MECKFENISLLDKRQAVWYSSYGVSWGWRLRFSGDSTCLTASQNIHERGLSSPRDSHESSQHSRTESPADAYQQLQHLFVVHGVYGGQIQAGHLLRQQYKN